MQTHSSSVSEQHPAVATADCQKAWYLLYVVLSLDRPAATLMELASLCFPFRATEDLVRRLCSLTNSPIELTYCGGGGGGGGDCGDGVYVTVSEVGMSAMKRFVKDSDSIQPFLNWIGQGLGTDLAGRALKLQEAVRMYINKRKRIGFVRQEVGNEESVASSPSKRIRTAGFEAPFSVVDGGSWDARAMSKFTDIKLDSQVLVPDCFSESEGVGSRLDNGVKDMKQIKDEYDLSSVSEGDVKKIVYSADAYEESGVHTVELDNLMDIMLSSEVQSPKCFWEAVLRRLNYRLKDVQQVEDEHVSTAILDEQKTVTSVVGAPEESGLETWKLDSQEFELDVEIGELEFRANGEGETIVPAECHSVNDFFKTGSQLVAQTFECIHSDEVYFGSIQTESGTSDAKTGVGAMSMATYRKENKVQESSNKGSIPTDTEVDKVGVHARINTDSAICLREVGESICTVEVGTPEEAGKSNVTLKENKEQESSNKGSVSTDAEVDQVEFHTRTIGDEASCRREVMGSIEIPVESIQTAKVGTEAEVGVSALKTGFGGMSMETDCKEKMEESSSSSRGSVPTNVTMDQVEFHRRTNGDETTCLREVENSLNIPVESIHEVGTRLEVGTEAESGTSNVTLKTGLGGMVEADGKEKEESFRKVSVPTNVKLDQTEFHTRTNGDKAICLGEVEDSITAPMESIHTIEVGIRAEIGTEAEAGKTNVPTKTGLPYIAMETDCRGKMVQASSNKGSVPTDARVDQAECHTRTNGDTVPVESIHTVEVTARAEAALESGLECMSMETDHKENKVHGSSNKESVPDDVKADQVEVEARTNGDEAICLGEVEGSIMIPMESIHTVGIRTQAEAGTSSVTVEEKVHPFSNRGTSPTDANNHNGFNTLDFSSKTRIANRDGTSSRHQALLKPLDGIKPNNPEKGKQKKQGHEDHRVHNCIPRSSKRKHDDAQTREATQYVAAVSSQDQLEPKDLPSFESYIVEGEEGSGGYGTVYRARKKTDGSTVAIKCPHPNAHKQHVTNERRMLERFGGKNFVIRYEGSFTSEDLECFVLEHIEHDRPEVLKREIDLVQLRSYAFCLFRALSSLHKQGIVHRDVKPGNFLFSRKTNKGCLIDFNLALDLHQQYGSTAAHKLRAGSSYQPVKTTRLQRKTLEPKNCCKTRSVAQQSQGAEASGITSVKDMTTSTRTPSAERLREPLPCHGRKELLTLLQENMNPNNLEASSRGPISMRKRVAAAAPPPHPPSKVNAGPVVYVTPMPLQPSGFGVAVCGLTNKSKDGKMKKEGPCVGTKGFRAPEVLLRSLYQGPKVDTWSAGVTLLYLMIGATPFYGEPEQNIKDIAKLRGSEDLWEVAKLHDRESSFPPDLYTTKSLPSFSLREWCRLNTRRRSFVDQMPASLVDLVDKCLIVNPRSRISCEEALKHEFFSPLYNEMAAKRQKLVRQGTNTDTGTKLPFTIL